MFLLTYPFSKRCNSSWRKFMLHWKRLLLCYMCTHADSRTECCHHGWYLKSKVLWSPQGQIKQLHSQHALFCTILAVKLTKTPHPIEFQITFWILFKLDQEARRDFSHVQVKPTIPAPIFHLSALPAFPPQHLQQASTSAEGMTQGKPTVLLFTFHPRSPLTHGCYRSELSTNQLSTHIFSVSTVCV